MLNEEKGFSAKSMYIGIIGSRQPAFLEECV